MTLDSRKDKLLDNLREEMAINTIFEMKGFLVAGGP